MNPVSRIVSYARVELEDIFKHHRFVAKDELDEAVLAAKEHAQARLKLEISEDQVLEATHTLEGLFNVQVGADATLVSNEGHEEWLDGRKNEITWHYWERYKRWLLEDELRPSSVIDGALDPVTDRVLGMLEDPLRPGAWSRRGLVAGQVQSGKTSNYVGLINKALDAGYKLIVVLAGTHDNLRSQTQVRINSGVLGFNTQGNINGSQGQRIGVGLKDPLKPRINCPTSSAEKGDFNTKLAQGVGALGGDPVIFVVKKNTSILRNLHLWATGMHHEVNAVDGKKIVRDVPLLVIDDEADNASIDTGSVKNKVTGDESDPSATNKLIRQFLGAFEKSAYVGYTATPFANIYINPSVNHAKYGPDLFPEHFIVTLPETSAYSGAARIFGLTEDEGEGIEGVQPVPTTRKLDDYDVWLPDRHKKTHVPDEDLPDSLVSAVYSFIVASALKKYRRVRMKHNSMLVHVTRFVDVQTAVTEQVEDLIEEIRLDLSYSSANDPKSKAWTALRSLYDTDFVPTTRAMQKVSDLQREVGETPAFAEIEELLREVARDVKVRPINGEASEGLQYEEAIDGLTVIAIGGDKLSRGLTLEGLTTSYYLRASKMYDTLMQMGRWFGFRPGYLDVCRLYTTEQLVSWYGRITGASERLYREFELMAALGRTPQDFGLRVQTHPDGLMVTAANKSRFAKTVRASFSGAVTETILFKDDEDARKKNWEALERLVSQVSQSPDAQKQISPSNYWRGVPALPVIEFLNSYDADKAALRALPKAMAEYVRASLSLAEPELTRWDVLVASLENERGSASKLKREKLGNNAEVRLVRRDGMARSGIEGPTFVIKRLVNSRDELLPLEGEPAKFAQALAQAQLNWDQATRRSEKRPVDPTAVAERRVRSRQRGYLLVYPLQREIAGLEEHETPYVGLAIAFPWSDLAPAVNYRVNEVYWDLAMADALTEDSDD